MTLMEHKRSLKDIQQEFVNTCAQLGELEHNLSKMPERVKELKKKLLELESEAFRLPVEIKDEALIE